MILIAKLESNYIGDIMVFDAVDLDIIIAFKA